MARDRKRSKQRRARKAPASQPAVQHEPGMPDAEPAVPEAVGPPVVPGRVERAPAEEELGRREAAEETGEDELAPAGPVRGAPPAARPKPAGSRVAAFMRASWAELQRVQWPNRRQVGQATAVVLGFVVIAGSFLGLADLLASNLVDAIL